MFSFTYSTISDLNFAIKHQGYQITRVYETLTYRSSSNFMQPFFAVTSQMMHAIKRPRDMDKQEYKNIVNNEINDDPFSLPLEDEDLNDDQSYEDIDFLKKILKVSTNAMSGRIMMKLKDRWQMAKSNENFMHHLIKDEVVGLKMMKNGRMAMNLINTFNRKDPHINCLVGAIWTSHGRIKLFKLLMEVLENCKSAKPLYMDCDSLIYYCDKNEQYSPEIGITEGKLKHEIPEAKDKFVSFHCLGPKRYNLAYLNDEGVLVQHGKFSGLNMKQVCNAYNQVNSTNLDDILLNGSEIKVPQYKGQTRNTFEKALCNYTLSRKTVGQKRVLIENTKTLVTLPFGYSMQMYLKLQN